MSDSNITALAFQLETAFGVAAVPVALRKLRFTKETLDHDKMTVESQDIREDRQTEEVIEVGVEAKGGFEFELAVGEYDEFFAAALMGVFADVGGVPTLKNGVTKSSFVLEKKILADAFASFSGMTVDQMTLTISSRQLITGSVAFIGKGGAVAAASLDVTGGYTLPSTGLKLSASADVGDLLVDGAAVGGLKSVTITINNNLRANDVIASKTMEEVGVGSVKVSGKIDAYFRNRTLLEKFMAHQTIGLAFTVAREAAAAVAGDLLGYTFTMPKLHLPKGMPLIGGKDQDVMLPLEYTAIASGPAGYTMSIAKVLKA